MAGSISSTTTGHSVQHRDDVSVVHPSDAGGSDVAKLEELDDFDPSNPDAADTPHLDEEVLLSLVALVVGEDRQLCAKAVADSIQAEINRLRETLGLDPNTQNKLLTTLQNLKSEVETRWQDFEKTPPKAILSTGEQRQFKSLAHFAIYRIQSKIAFGTPSNDGKETFLDPNSEIYANLLYEIHRRSKTDASPPIADKEVFFKQLKIAYQNLGAEGRSNPMQGSGVAEGQVEGSNAVVQPEEPPAAVVAPAAPPAAEPTAAAPPAAEPTAVTPPTLPPRNSSTAAPTAVAPTAAAPTAAAPTAAAPTAAAPTAAEEAKAKQATLEEQAGLNEAAFVNLSTPEWTKDAIGEANTFVNQAIQNLKELLEETDKNKINQKLKAIQNSKNLIHSKLADIEGQYRIELGNPRNERNSISQFMQLKNELISENDIAKARIKVYEVVAELVINLAEDVVNLRGSTSSGQELFELEANTLKLLNDNHIPFLVDLNSAAETVFDSKQVLIQISGVCDKVNENKYPAVGLLKKLNDYLGRVNCCLNNCQVIGSEIKDKTEQWAGSNDQALPRFSAHIRKSLPSISKRVEECAQYGSFVRIMVEQIISEIYGDLDEIKNFKSMEDKLKRQGEEVENIADQLDERIRAIQTIISEAGCGSSIDEFVGLARTNENDANEKLKRLNAQEFSRALSEIFFLLYDLRIEIKSGPAKIEDLKGLVEKVSRLIEGFRFSENDLQSLNLSGFQPIENEKSTMENIASQFTAGEEMLEKAEGELNKLIVFLIINRKMAYAKSALGCVQEMTSMNTIVSNATSKRNDTENADLMAAVCEEVFNQAKVYYQARGVESRSLINSFCAEFFEKVAEEAEQQITSVIKDEMRPAYQKIEESFQEFKAAANDIKAAAKAVIEAETRCSAPSVAHSPAEQISRTAKNEKAKADRNALDEAKIQLADKQELLINKEDALSLAVSNAETAIERIESLRLNVQSLKERVNFLMTSLESAPQTADLSSWRSLSADPMVVRNRLSYVKATRSYLHLLNCEAHASSSVAHLASLQIGTIKALADNLDSTDVAAASSSDQSGANSGRKNSQELIKSANIALAKLRAAAATLNSIRDKPAQLSKVVNAKKLSKSLQGDLSQQFMDLSQKIPKYAGKADNLEKSADKSIRLMESSVEQLTVPEGKVYEYMFSVFLDSNQLNDTKKLQLIKELKETDVIEYLRRESCEDGTEHLSTARADSNTILKLPASFDEGLKTADGAYKLLAFLMFKLSDLSDYQVKKSDDDDQNKVKSAAKPGRPNYEAICGSKKASQADLKKIYSEIENRRVLIDYTIVLVNSVKDKIKLDEEDKQETFANVFKFDAKAPNSLDSDSNEMIHPAIEFFDNHFEKDALVKGNKQVEILSSLVHRIQKKFESDDQAQTVKVLSLSFASLCRHYLKTGVGPLANYINRVHPYRQGDGLHRELRKSVINQMLNEITHPIKESLLKNGKTPPKKGSPLTFSGQKFIDDESRRLFLNQYHASPRLRSRVLLAVLINDGFALVKSSAPRLNKKEPFRKAGASLSYKGTDDMQHKDSERAVETRWMRQDSKITGASKRLFGIRPLPAFADAASENSPQKQIEGMSDLIYENCFQRDTPQGSNTKVDKDWKERLAENRVSLFDLCDIMRDALVAMHPHVRAACSGDVQHALEVLAGWELLLSPGLSSSPPWDQTVDSALILPKTRDELNAAGRSLTALVTNLVIEPRERMLKYDSKKHEEIHNARALLERNIQAVRNAPIPYPSNLLFKGLNAANREVQAHTELVVPAQLDLQQLLEIPISSGDGQEQIIFDTDKIASAWITLITPEPTNSEGHWDNGDPNGPRAELLRRDIKQLQTLIFPTPNELGEWEGKSDKTRLRAKNNLLGEDEGQLAELVRLSIEEPFPSTVLDSEETWDDDTLKTHLRDRETLLSMALRKVTGPAVGPRLIPGKKSENAGVRLQNGFLKSEELKQTLESLQSIADRMQSLGNLSPSLEARKAAIETLVLGFNDVIRVKNLLEFQEGGQKPSDIANLTRRLVNL